MTRKENRRWILLVAANAAFWCMLSFQQTVGAGRAASAQSGIGPSPTQQRAEIIAQLKEIKGEIKHLVNLRQNGALPETDPSLYP